MRKMIKANFSLNIWIGIFLCLLIVSCSDDNDDSIKGNDDNTDISINHWIEKKLRNDYLWYSELPATNKIDYTADPEAFFYSLLSLKDGKTRNGKHLYYYSYMKKNKGYKTRTSIDADNTYGMEFTLFSVVDRNNKPLGYYYARVLYILPDSPADKAGLERGDWIIGINGKNNIKEGNYKTLFSGSATQWTITHNETTKTIDIEASTAVEDNPLYYHDVLTVGDKKIGYLVYNHFTPGPKGVEDRTYDEEMKTIFADFQSRGVNEFVLDLRYNGGGYEHSANMLAGLLIPEESKDNVFGIFSNNKGKVTHTRYFNTETKGTAGYLKLNSNRIYILTSENTASSSELVISSLEPFMNIVLIGQLTEGKNFGMQEYSDDKYEWAYWPITTRVTNAINSDYSAGFTPDYDWNEFNLSQNPEDTLLPLGDSNEFMLNKAITLITGTHRKTRNMTILSQTILRGQPVYQSIDRHTTGGVLLCPIEME